MLRGVLTRIPDGRNQFGQRAHGDRASNLRALAGGLSEGPLHGIDLSAAGPSGPATRWNNLDFKGFYVRGGFEIVEQINNNREAVEAWKEFRPAFPS